MRLFIAQDQNEKWTNMISVNVVERRGRIGNHHTGK